MGPMDGKVGSRTTVGNGGASGMEKLGGGSGPAAVDAVLRPMEAADAGPATNGIEGGAIGDGLSR